MTPSELEHLLNSFRSLPGETEVVEFKEAKTTYDFTKLGKYFSALANEANLKGKPCAWLIFGVKDKGRTIVGSQFRPDRSDLDSLKGEIANKTTNRITFIDIHELFLMGSRVIMFQVPAAPKGFPIAFEGHYYGRDGEELSPLNLENKDLSLEEIIMLDKVQKRKILTDAEIQHLRQKKLIEGKKPNLFISAKVAQSTGQKAVYSKYKAFDDKYYQDLVLKAIREHSFLDRSDIDELLWSKLPDWMDDKQRKIKVNNLISRLRKDDKIKNAGSDTKPRWVLV